MVASGAAPKFFTYKNQVPLAQGQGLYFTAGRGYHAGPAHAYHSLGSLAAPLTDEQVAQQQVKAAFDPILNNLTQQYNARGESMGRAITGSTDELARLMSSYGPTSAAAYDQAASNDAAINSALAATRQGQGAAASAELAGKLGGIDSATTARVNGGLTGDLAGEATAAATRGANNLAMLLGQGASAADFGAKLPGIAGGIGLNAQKQTQGQISSDLNTQLEALAAQEPRAVSEALAAIQSNRAKNKQLAFEQSLKNAEFGLAQKKANTSASQGRQRIGIAQQNANTSAQRAADASARGWKALGIREKAAQAKAAALDKKQKSGGFTPNEIQRFKGSAYATADDSYHGYSVTSGSGANATTTQKAGVAYGVAMNRMLRQGIPPSIAQAELNQFYKPGERGRPYSAAQQKANAKQQARVYGMFPVYGG